MDLSRYVSSIEGKIKAEDRMAELKRDGGDSLEFLLMDFGDYYPNALRELTSLKHLSIIHCHTWQEHPAWIADMPLIETLNLSQGGGVEELHCQITSCLHASGFHKDSMNNKPN